VKKLFLAFLICFAASATFANPSNLFEANNAFSFGLAGQIASAQPGQNIFISPYSVSIVLQMLATGASGKTKTEIQQVLKTEDIPPWLLDNQYEMLKSLQTESNVDFNLANSIWFNKGFELKSAFVNTNEALFQAKLASVDFQSPETADVINGWAKQNTKGKITDIVSFPFPQPAQLLAANAIYFKGRWAEPFDKSLTQPREFYGLDGKTKRTPMMSQHEKIFYEDGDNFHAVELPYASDRLEMVLFLPATNSSPQKLLADFAGRNQTNWPDNIVWHFASREGTVIFPKFKMNYDITLNGPLKSLGMRQAFIEDAANFSGIADSPLFVSEVLQKSFVSVDEEGTEAYAATVAWGLNGVEMKPPPPFEMIVDRPFLFLIADEATQAILFIGIINDPTL
jgi:serpin B